MVLSHVLYLFYVNFMYRANAGQNDSISPKLPARQCSTQVSCTHLCDQNGYITHVQYKSLYRPYTPDMQQFFSTRLPPHPLQNPNPRSEIHVTKPQLPRRPYPAASTCLPASSRAAATDCLSLALVFPAPPHPPSCRSRSHVHTRSDAQKYSPSLH